MRPRDERGGDWFARMLGCVLEHDRLLFLTHIGPGGDGVVA